MLESYVNLCDLLQPRDGDVVSVIGAGGKHTLMYRLSDELVAAGRQVVLTSTTNLHRNVQRTDVATVVADECDDWPGALAAMIGQDSRAVLVASNLGTNMHRGFEPQTVEKIRDAVPRAVVVVKADGARKRLLKAPGEDEPVYPPGGNLCVLVLSLDAIGKPLDPAHVHRIERVRALTDGEQISAQTLIDVIGGHFGYARRFPSPSRRILYLSCCNSPEAERHAREIFAETEDLFDRQICGDTIDGRYHA